LQKNWLDSFERFVHRESDKKRFFLLPQHCCMFEKKKIVPQPIITTEAHQWCRDLSNHFFENFF